MINYVTLCDKVWSAITSRTASAAGVSVVPPKFNAVLITLLLLLLLMNDFTQRLWLKNVNIIINK